MKTKRSYRVRNWSDYNRSLVARGSIELWITRQALAQWRYRGQRRAGGVQFYSDLAIQACLLVREVYQLSDRQCEGFLRSLARYLPIDRIPNYSTLCRRMARLDVKQLVPLRKKLGAGPLHVLIDSSGLKITGQGEWIHKKHGVRPHALWAKMHLALDHQTRDVLAIEHSEAHGYDSKFLAPLLDGLDWEVSCIYGDGAYDKRLCYETAYRLGAQLIAPVQHGARKQRANRNIPNHPALKDRDRKLNLPPP